MKPASLRLQLLRRLLPAMLVLLLCGAGTAYWVAWHSATKAYDRALFDTTLAIADQLKMSGDKPLLPLTPQARAVLLRDNYDQVYYAVRGPDGELVDGEAGLQLPVSVHHRLPGGERHYYFDGYVNDKPIRIAALETEVSERVFTILSGETLVKRNALVREILLGMLLPELLLTIASISVVWFGISSGLMPLSKLRTELAERSHADLSPIQVDVPDELQPVIVEINELLNRLDHSLSSQRNFVSDAAHQLRNPIAALQAQVEAVASESPHDKQKFGGLLAATQRLSHLIDQMLALARAEPSPAQTYSKISLTELVGVVAETWLPKAIQQQIDLGFELSPTLVSGNSLLLQELLGNLLDNAIRHTPPDGSITVSCGQNEMGAWLTVEDSGEGIPEIEWESVFERFYQLPRGLREGNGLGLAIVRSIARQHGGEVLAGQSPKLGGAMFKVTLNYSH
ncbi:MAG: sensor histidine kinase [Azonexaceae bacterium]|nr:sensor histidine kinase [Azonexaceae bacterium]